MNIETSKEKICVNKIVAQKKEQAIIENDLIVPDIKPDVIECISTSGNICIYKKEILDGRVRIDGCIDTYIMYLTEGEDSLIRSINTSMDFTHIIDIDKCMPDMSLDLTCCIKKMDCKVLNGRKVSLKAIVEFNVNIYENKEEEIIKEIVGMENIEKKNKMLTINSIIGEGTTKVIAKDTVPLDENCKLDEILNAKCIILNKEYKTSYNKILAKADLDIKILYLSNNLIKTNNVRIPIMGFINIQNVSEENKCEINYMIKNIIIKPNNSDENSINIEVEIEISAIAYEEKKIEVIDDLYNPECDIKFTTKDIEAVTGNSNVTKKIEINENINLNDMGINNVVEVESIPNVIKTNISNNKIIYEGDVNVKIISETNLGVEVKQINIPFNTEIITEDSINDMLITNSIEIEKQNIKINDRNMEYILEININSNISKKSNIRIIDTLEYEEYEVKSNCGMTIYFVKKGDTLWDIAKRFRTTVDTIINANELESDNVEVGKQLIIPSYKLSNKRILV